MTWDDIGALLEGLLYGLAKEWRCVLPEYNQLPAIADEARCDAWVKLFFAQPEPLPHCAEELRPWILARLATCGANARKLAIEGAIPPQVEKPVICQYLLVE